MDEAKNTSREITFWSVGQGDFVSLISTKTCLFFDIGGSQKLTESSLKRLKEGCSGKTNRLYISHFDQDHIRNYRQLVQAVVIQRAFLSHLDPKSHFGKKFLRELERYNILISKIDQRYHFRTEGISIRCLWPAQNMLKIVGENNWSLVLLLRVFSRTFLMTGDIPSKMEKKISVPPTEILKVAHHGSRTSSEASFLKRVNPRICIVSVGAKNSYHHPTSETLRRLIHENCTILRTDRLGSITFEL